jgi:hypothetical protein
MTGSLLLDAIVLLATVAVTGLALLRPLLGEVGRACRLLAFGAGLLAVAGAAAPRDSGTRPALVVLQAALVLVTGTFLVRRTAVVGGALLAVVLAVEAAGGRTGTAALAAVIHAVAAAVWTGAALAVALGPPGARTRVLRAVTPWAVAAAVLVTVTGIVGAWQAGLRADAPSAESGFGTVVLAKAVLALLAALAVVALWRDLPRRTAGRLRTAQAAALGLATLAATTLAVAPVPSWPPTAGVPLLRSVPVHHQPVPVAVIPQQPGANLVHTDGSDVTVGTDPERLAAVSPRPGADGGWALVSLPPGPSRLWVRRHGELESVRVDTGHTRRVSAGSITGPDGAECASSALGAVVAGASTAMTSCPADQLTGTDAESLRDLAAFLARRGLGAVRLVGDSSARSVEAVRVFRSAAEVHGLPVRTGTGAGTAEVVVGGWRTGDASLRRLARGGSAGGGTYLAPWLATRPLLQYSTGAVVALRFDPYARPGLDYVTALTAALPLEAPSAAGYAGWREARGDRGVGPTTLYAAAQVSYLPTELGHDHAGGGWVRGGRLTAVTGPLRR